ncbi:MAG: YlxM family DNA-binding protein [Lachnospiraceae bacterium]|nr:YlxM family DNA-binding protein [Lachnospiraceae bacterium]
MEKIFEQGLLYDFYGELLTEHQRSIYEDAVFNDMSLGEIAEERGISRQGVHDLIKRCDKILQDYESKLHLVERFAKAKETIGEIVLLTQADDATADGKADTDDAKECNIALVQLQTMQNRMRRIRQLSEDLRKEL